jgi:2',3'-cyclic-nucleotide 2'-phosphodiesterase (5'-nucleotidase family)
LARRATFIKDLKKEGKELLILDAGNSFFKPKDSPSSQERKSARLIATAYKQMGYQAVNIGSDDLLAGIEFLRELEREIHLPLLSANLLEEEGGNPVFKSHAVLDSGGIRVGVFGLTSDIRQNGGVTSEGYFISNPIAAAKRMAAELGRDCDVIVGLSNLGSFKEYSKLIQQVKDVQFIIGSGGRGAYHQTLRSDRGWEAFLFQAYPKGQYLGRIDLNVLKGVRDFIDLSRKVNMERQINSIERQLDFYRRGTGRAKSIPQDRRQEYIKKLEEFKKRSEARLKELERDSRRNSTFIGTTISLDEKVKDDPEMKELVDRFKRGS